MTIYELPPVLKGDEAQQIKDLRDYLARLVLQLNEANRTQSREETKK